MRKSRFPAGWNEKRVRKVIAHYEGQTDAEAVAEDESAYGHRRETMMEVPRALVPKVRALISKHRRTSRAG